MIDRTLESCILRLVSTASHAFGVSPLVLLVMGTRDGHAAVRAARAWIVHELRTREDGTRPSLRDVAALFGTTVAKVMAYESDEKATRVRFPWPSQIHADLGEQRRPLLAEKPPITEEDMEMYMVNASAEAGA